MPNPRHFSLFNQSEFSSTLQISAAALFETSAMRLLELRDALLVHVLDLSLDTTVLPSGYVKIAMENHHCLWENPL